MQDSVVVHQPQPEVIPLAALVAIQGDQQALARQPVLASAGATEPEAAIADDIDLPPLTPSQRVAGCIGMLLNPLHGTPCSSTDVRRSLREATRGEHWAASANQVLNTGDMDEVIPVLQQLMPAQVMGLALELMRRHMDSAVGAGEGDEALQHASSEQGPIALMQALQIAEQDDVLCAWHELLAYLLSLPGTQPLSAQDALCKVAAECVLPLPRFRGEQVKRLHDAFCRLLRGDTEGPPVQGAGNGGPTAAKPLVGIGNAGATSIASRGGHAGVARNGDDSDEDPPPSTSTPPAASRGRASAPSATPSTGSRATGVGAVGRHFGFESDSDDGNMMPRTSAAPKAKAAATGHKQMQDDRQQGKAAASTASLGSKNSNDGLSAYQRAKLGAANGRTGGSEASLSSPSNMAGMSAYQKAKLASTGGSNSGTANSMALGSFTQSPGGAASSGAPQRPGFGSLLSRIHTDPAWATKAMEESDDEIADDF